MFSISSRTRLLLEQLEQHIDPQIEEDLQRQWSDFLFDRFEGVIFEPSRRTPVQVIACDAVNINDAIDDFDTMLYAQLSGAAGVLSSSTGTPAVRANYGTGILSSVLGAELLWYFRDGFHSHALEDVQMLVNVIKHKRDGAPLCDRFFRRPFEAPQPLWEDV